MQEPLSGWADARHREALDVRGVLVTTWAVGGVALLLVNALVRLTPLAAEPLLDGTLSAPQAALYAGWVVLMAWSEGYRGFQRRFVPRVVGRAFHLGARRGPWWHAALGPAFAMSLFHAQRRTLIVSWTLIVGLTALVALMRQVPQPWRGIVDGGVVVGLSWGLVALLVETVRAFGQAPPHPSDLPPRHGVG